MPYTLNVISSLLFFSIQKFLTIFTSNVRLDLDQSDPVLSGNMSLRINGSGHVIHAFVNGEHIGNVNYNQY